MLLFVLESFIHNATNTKQTAIPKLKHLNKVNDTGI
jgi:hypothetical protein